MLNIIISLMVGLAFGIVIMSLLTTAGQSDKDAEIIELKNENIELKRQLHIINKVNEERTITVEEYECTINLYDKCKDTCCYQCNYDFECEHTCTLNPDKCGKSKRG